MLSGKDMENDDSKTLKVRRSLSVLRFLQVEENGERVKKNLLVRERKSILGL